MDVSLDSIAYHEGDYRPMHSCHINIACHSFQYGTMVIGGIRGYYNQEQDEMYLFRVDQHVKRLLNSARIMQMKPSLSQEKIEEIICELAKRNQIRKNTYFRPCIYKSDLKLSPRLHDVNDSFSLYMIPLEDYLDTKRGLKVGISTWRRVEENMIPARVKSSGGYINSALAKSEAILNGYDEAIFLDARGMVSEGSAENIFIVRDNCLITPPPASGVLEGITRRTILELASDLKLAVLERDVARAELYISDEIFLCGTGAQIAWVQEVDRRPIGNGNIGEITSQLQGMYNEIITGKNEFYSKWLTPIYSSHS